MSVFAMICRECRYTEDVKGKVGVVPECFCALCGKAMQRSFCWGGAALLNLGYRPERYSNQTDRDIANYQFTHL